MDNLYVVLDSFKDLTLPSDKEEVTQRLTTLVDEIHWNTGLEVWRRLVGKTNTKGLTLADLLRHRGGSGDWDDDARRPKFRVTCNRSGTTHKFTSMEAAAMFGGAVNDTFHWGVDMKNYDLEVVLNVAQDSLYVCLGLTRESLHRRNLDQFGPTSLRCTIAYNMLRCQRMPWLASGSEGMTSCGRTGKIQLVGKECVLAHVRLKCT